MKCFLLLSFAALPIAGFCSGNTLLPFPTTPLSVNSTYRDSSIKGNSDTVSGKVEIEASVDKDAWRDQLVKVLTPVLNRAAKKRMKPGTYIVQVRFLVEKDGSISDVVAMNDPGYGLAEGAVRAVRTGPHWLPGSIDGRKVRSYHTQPITYVITVD